jgi:hypothetical protein
LNQFISPEYASLLHQHQLDSFAKLWQYEVNWFETPNHRRGGWSGVARMQLEADDKTHGFFIKKQQNHGRWSLATFPRQEPTFRREFQHLQFLQRKQFAAPEVVFYGEQIVDGKMSAILMTKELAQYQPLDVVIEAADINVIAKQNKRQLLQVVAKAIRRFHHLHLMHRALYPKHIFVADAFNTPTVALIDLEKTRYSPFFWYNAYFDLAALNRHSIGWSKTSRLYFFKQYCQISQLTWVSKWLCRSIIARSARQKTAAKQRIKSIGSGA